MILVGQYDSPYVRRVAVTLHHYGMTFERKPISVFADAEEMAKINPVVRIPSLILDGGEVLIDSAAILDHLDEIAGPEKALMPRSGADRRRLMQIVASATGATDKAGAIVYERHFHSTECVNADWIARCKGQLAGALRSLEARLDGNWFGGAKPTQADITTGCLIGYLKLRLQEAFPAEEFPELTRHSEWCEGMPEFQACVPSPNEVMPSR